MTPHDPTGPLHGSAPRLPRAPEITEAECRRCGTLIAGLDGRYACGVCGWVNDHSEGHRPLPHADEDPDRPRGRAARSAKNRQVRGAGTTPLPGSGAPPYPC
ncbi:hypothetical protein LG634_36190 [Streptomyces bambusae]|uniref:hypothetical protein n=1 Tax=Streptomyces bambusae TaxID=1550616 RepID=UPI001CFF9843|nr:hypothetical protein [Streptomyces bambusae]MCB5170226.1 hypothetical protein [Streptomyces bambusae]